MENRKCSDYSVSLVLAYIAWWQISRKRFRGSVSNTDPTGQESAYGASIGDVVPVDVVVTWLYDVTHTRDIIFKVVAFGN